MRRTRALGFLTIVLGALWGACDDSTRTRISNIFGDVLTGRADSIAITLVESWNEPTGRSINPVKAPAVDELRVFRCCDGAGIAAWLETSPNGSQPKQFLFVAFFDEDGGMKPAVEILGDFPDLDAFDGAVGGPTLDSMIVAWTPSGDAILAFQAYQSVHPQGEDQRSRRVYYTTFKRSQADEYDGSGGERYGFVQDAVAVDSNVDDSGADTLFLATNLADGTLDFSLDGNNLGDCCTGSKGDNPEWVGDPFLFLGWRYLTPVGYRLEGAFVDLGTLALGEPEEIDTNPAIEEFESVGAHVWTSGRDILFSWEDFSLQGAVPANDLCADAIEIFDGDTDFCTLGSSTDGPGPSCTVGDPTNFGSDIWFRYTATCTGEISVSTCDQASFDTVLAVYDGCIDPVELGCNDDGAGCSAFTSSLTAPAVEGTEYLIQVGGFDAAQGTGTLTIECIEPPAFTSDWIASGPSYAEKIAQPQIDALISAGVARLNLARVDLDGNDLEPTVDVSDPEDDDFDPCDEEPPPIRYITDVHLIGQGYKILNGQYSSWVVFRERFDTGDGDLDLAIAQVAEDGTVQIRRYDHFEPGLDFNDVHDLRVEIGRGATRAFLYYLATDRVDPGAAGGGENTSLFCRALLLDEDRPLGANVSNEVRCNSVYVDLGAEFRPDILNYHLADVDPFCSPQCNNDCSCVAFRQALPFRQDGLRIAYARQCIEDIGEGVFLTSMEQEIKTDLDRDIYFDIAPVQQSSFDLVVLPLNDPDGDCLVSFIINGNNADDRDAEDWFYEPRPFVWAPQDYTEPSIAGDEEPCVEIGSNNFDQLAHGNYAIIDGYDNLSGVPTPGVPADRDCRFDLDEECPDYAHIFFFEFVRDPDGGQQTIWRARCIDLRDADEPEFIPPLEERPAAVGTGNNSASYFNMRDPYFGVVTQGNNLLAVFNEVVADYDVIGFVCVNTWGPGPGWSVAAPLNNYLPGPIQGDFDLVGYPRLVCAAGVQEGCCESIVGTWVLWLEQPDDPDVDYLEGRRMYALDLDKP